MFALALAMTLVASSPSPAPSPEARAIMDLVLESQQAGLERHDTDAYMAVWSRDAKWVFQRLPKPGRHDLTTTYAQALERGAIRKASTPPPGLSLRHEDQKVRFDVFGRRATYTCMTVVRIDGYLERTGEIYDLKKTGDGWRIIENRFWVEMTSWQGDVTRYDRSYWEQADRDADQAKRDGTPQEQTTALMRARRFPEAHGVTRAWTKANPALTKAWGLRAEAAWLAADYGDVKLAVRTVRKAAPGWRTMLPNWAEGVP